MARRAAPIWIPTFVEVEGAAANMARRNLWRLTPMYEMDDLMQEAAISFLRVQTRYPRIVDPPHFMAMFKTVYSNRLHTLAAARGKSASGHVVVPVADPEERDPLAGLAAPCGDLTRDDRLEARIARASPELRALVHNVYEAARAPKRRRKASGSREPLNTFLCRLAEVDPSRVNMREQLDALLNSI